MVVSTQEGKSTISTDRQYLSLRQRFVPFTDLSNPAITSMDFLFGSVSLVFSSASGANRVFSLYVSEGSTERLRPHENLSCSARRLELLRHELA